MKLTSSKLIEKENKKLFEVTLNAFLVRIKPKDLIEVKFAESEESYSALIIYRYKLGKKLD